MAGRLVLALSILVAVFGFAAAAKAETITGKFQYLDRDLNFDGTVTTTTLRPIVAATVEVYARAPGANWDSSPSATTTTDATGTISVSLTRPVGTTYALRVYATNDAAVVWPKVVFPTGPYYQQPGEPDGTPITHDVNSPTETLHFDYDFKAFWPAAHFNMADTIRLGREYAQARRDPLESDPIPQVSVQPSSGWAGVSHYNFTIDQLLIRDYDMFDDAALLHEYAHFLEEKISKFAPIASVHDGCKATLIGDATATPINSPEHAWMEGFADYFAAAVIASLPSGRTDVFNMATGANLEAPPGIFVVSSCTLVRASFPRDTIELDVAAVLWDLLDGPPGESADTVSGRDVEIFRIFDHELATPWDPTIEDFRAAWVARGLPAAALGRIYTLNGLTFRRNLAPIADAGADRQVYEGGPAMLDGTMSEDPENAALTFAWTQTGGPTVSLATPGAATTTFAAPLVGPAGTTLTFRLDVSDPSGQSATDFIQINVRDLPAYGELSPSPLDFGVSKAGVKVTKTVALRNIGPGPLVVGAFQVTGSTTFGFDGATCGNTLAPNASCSLTIRFTPPASGSVTGTLVVGTPNSPNPSVSIGLRGEGGTPSAALSTSSLSFGPVNVGAADSQQIRLSNTGTVPVTLASLQSWGGPEFSHTSCAATIPVNGSCLVTVTFQPTAAGPSSAWLYFEDDGGGPRYVQLSGTGLAVGTPWASPSALPFGSVDVGDKSGVATVGLTNTGGAPLWVSDVRVSGHYADFSIVADQCRGISVQPSSTCSVQVAFSPQATGARSGKLEFGTSNGVAASTLTGTGVGKPAQTAWAQFGFGPARNGFNAEEIGLDTTSAASLSLKWEVPFKAEAHSSPAVVDGVAYLGSDDGSVYAVDVASQTLLWSAATRGPVRSSPAVVDGVVYVGSDDGSVYAFDAAKGTPVWTFATGGPVEASPAVEGQLVVVGSLDGNVYALDAAGGKPVWTAVAGGPVETSPALVGQVVYAAGGNVIRAFELRRGRTLWTEFANGPVRTAVTFADGLVLVGSEAGRLYAFASASGAQQWVYDTPGPAVTALAGGYGIAFAGSEGGELTAIDTSSGSPIWTLASGRAWMGAVAAANGVVYGTTDDGDLHAVDVWTGAELTTVGAKALSSPAVTGGSVYVGTGNGLAAIAP